MQFQLNVHKTQKTEGAKSRNKQQLDNVAKVVAEGGRLIIFPEGTTHNESNVKRARSGAARILLAAHRKAEKEGFAAPKLVPVGLHYSNPARLGTRCSHCRTSNGI